MTIIICPGIHAPELTKSFIQECLNKDQESLDMGKPTDILIFPGEGYLTLSTFHILHFLRDRLRDKLESPLIFLCFSAGVIGGIGAATGWQLLGGHVQAFIAIDGWGVPLGGNFPIHRLSHDHYTHWTSAYLGIRENNFYADPAVDHLSMWHSPQTVPGKWVNPPAGFSPPKNYLTASEFLNFILQQYHNK
ncbi:hypothetical protein H6F39_13930 [Anabaena sp. FACHB-1250]|uniref:Uncharacterized protein n=1 Tax=Dolichospermum planctonicum TaxID=136072 RepID=A0A480AHI4_9CYAN|nr:MULTISPECIES: hypothetical protein [Nostocales]MBD2142429.1 hypothetical protein [Anabaena sp. FACHB-1250]MBD2269997.1 hypothetical protein [Anabaena sp. FACHB-1391]GCL43546.1 hypothetical protein NIES80_32620 [Dolichospermum planctonicum]